MPLALIERNEGTSSFNLARNEFDLQDHIIKTMTTIEKVHGSFGRYVVLYFHDMGSNIPHMLKNMKCKTLTPPVFV